MINIYYFIPYSDYFQTFGFEVVDGKNLQELDHTDFQENDIIVTTDLVDKIASGKTLTGKTIYNAYDADTTYYPVKSVMGSMRARSFEQESPVGFLPLLDIDVEDAMEGLLLIRLKPGVSEQSFINSFLPWARQQLKAGNLYVRDVQPYRELLSKLEYGYGVTNKYRMNLTLALFFLINLALGVTGTFWLQTRSRREEVGIMLSYGASAKYIKQLLMGEAAILATLAWALGCLIYLQYGIANGNWYQQGAPGIGHWINNFWLHYAAMSMIVYVIILFVVLLGVYIPAYRISRISPTDALRDE